MSFPNWISKCILTNDIDSVLSMPVKLLDKHEHNLITYIINNYNLYGALPTIESIVKDVDNAKLMLNENVPNVATEQLLSEAKKSCYEREVRELLSSGLNDDRFTYEDVGLKISELTQLLGKKSKPIDYSDDSIYQLPKTKFNFKYNHLNIATKSLLGGEVCLLVGQLKSKKTWITLDLALDAYINQNKKVYFTSLEMSPLQIQQRINALIGGFNPDVFRIGTKTDIDNAKNKFKMQNDVIKTKTSGSLIIPEKMTNTVDDVIRDVREYEPDIVFVDSVYLFQDRNGKPIQSDWGALANMIAQLKHLAREKDIQVICNSQLKRGGDGDDIDDVGYSHAFAQTCDIVVSVLSDDSGTVERSLLKVLVSRNGGNTNSGFVTFDWDTCTINEYHGKFNVP